MKHLPKEKFVGTEGLIKRLEAKVASLEQQVIKLQEKTTRKDISSAPNIVSYGSISPAISARGGIAKYIDVRNTKLTDSYGGHQSVLQSLTASKNNVVWDATAGCYKFYGVYKE